MSTTDTVDVEAGAEPVPANQDPPPAGPEGEGPDEAEAELEEDDFGEDDFGEDDEDEEGEEEEEGPEVRRGTKDDPGDLAAAAISGVYINEDGEIDCDVEEDLDKCLEGVRVLRKARGRRKKDALAAAAAKEKAVGHVHGADSRARAPQTCDRENVCRIKPRFSEKFRPGDVQKVIEEEMRAVLAEQVFDDALAQGWITQIVAKINERVVKFGFPRYKTITQVTIVQQRGQSTSVAARCCWDASTDSMATFNLNTETMVASGTVYGLYHY